MMLSQLFMCWPFKMIFLHMYPCAKLAKMEFQTDIYIYTQWTHDQRSKNAISTWSAAYSTT